MDLPSELILHVVGYLEKSDLKNARFISKGWSACCVPRLFQKIYISLSEEDINVFKAVTENPYLRSYVRTLVYDTSEFSTNWTLKDYSRELCSQFFTTSPCTNSLAESCYGNKFLDEDIKNWLKDVYIWSSERAFERTSMEAFKKYGASNFMRDGFEIYKTHASHQRQVKVNHNFQQLLEGGFHCLSALEKVRVDQDWIF